MSTPSPWLAPEIPAEGLAAFGAEARAAGQRIIFTNGCFDLLHEGHLRSLLQAASLGDLLVVGLNSDKSVRELKGEGRPVVAEGPRSLFLRSLRCVGATTIFDDLSSLPTILALRPAILAKGGQYAEEEIVGAREVLAWGGHIARLDMVEGLSTTSMLHRIRGGEPDSKEPQ